MSETESSVTHFKNKAHNFADGVNQRASAAGRAMYRGGAYVGSGMSAAGKSMYRGGAYVGSGMSAAGKSMYRGGAYVGSGIKNKASEWSEENSKRDYGESTGRDGITKLVDGTLGDVTRVGVGLGVAGGVIGGATVGGIEIAKAAGDSGAKDISGAYGASANSFADSISQTGKFKDISSTNYAEAQNAKAPMGAAGYAMGGLGAGLSIIGSAADMYGMAKGANRWNKAKDAAGKKLGKESFFENAKNLVKDASSATGSIMNMAAGGATAGGAITAGIGGGITAATGLYGGGMDAFRAIKSKKMISDRGKKWERYVKNKKGKRMAMNALKIIGGGLGIAAAALGTAAGAGIPLLLAGAAVGGGMAIARALRKRNKQKTLEGYQEKLDKKRDAKASLSPELESDETFAGINPMAAAPEKGSKEENDKLQDMRLEEKAKKKGKDKSNVFTKSSIAKEIISFLQKKSDNITAKVVAWLGFNKDKKAAEKKKNKKPGMLSKISSFFGRKKENTDQEPEQIEYTNNPAFAHADSVTNPEVPEESSDSAPAPVEPSEPSEEEKTIFDAEKILTRIGVSNNEALSENGEELFEKRLSVTNSM
jgi:hypothetical protein